MPIIYIDFESFFDKSYSLRNMTMEAYIRDPRYETQLLGLAIDDSPIYMLEREQIPEVLSKLPLSHPNTWTVAHNMAFDGFITEDHYKIKIANPICTRAMARWTGISRVTRESQEALCDFLGTGVKGKFLENMVGRRCEDLSPQELQNYKDYCASDIAGLRKNFKAMLPYMTLEAMEFISMTTKMYTQPSLVLDTNLLQDYHERLLQAQVEARERLARLFRFNTQEEFLKALRSKTKFCEMLTSIGGVVPYKISEKKSETKRKQMEAQGLVPDDSCIVMEPALAKSDLAFMALQESDNEDVAALCRTRAENNSSIQLSRTETFLGISKRGLLPVPLEAYQAISGRYTAGNTDSGSSGEKTNLQNLSKRGGEKTLRQAITAPEGYVLVAGDSAQIEARVGAWIVGETQLVEAFANNQDPYIQLASTIYHVPEDQLYYWCKGEGFRQNLDEEMIKQATFHRFIGKTGILQLQYGSGASKLALFLNQNKVMLAENAEGHLLECKRIVDIYRSKYINIPAFWKVCNEIIKELYAGGSGYFGGPSNNTFYYDGSREVFGRRVPGIMFPDGYWLRYPNLRQEVNEEGRNEWVYDQMTKGRIMRTRLYGPKLHNNITQGLSFAIMRWQGIRIDKEYQVVSNCHDEWMSVVREEHVAHATEIYNNYLKMNPPWAQGVPLDCEVGSGRNYAEV